jgi:hypothetical protein
MVTGVTSDWGWSLAPKTVAVAAMGNGKDYIDLAMVVHIPRKTGRLYEGRNASAVQKDKRER